MQLKTVSEVVYELDNIALSKATSINGVLVQMWDRKVLTAYVEQKLHQDKSDIRAVLKANIKEKQDDFYSDREWPGSANMNDGYELACNDILTLIDTLLPGDVSK